jgi:exonuclease SbcC
MGLLEKLRPQPRWKHADPSVRAAAVYELGPEEAEALRALAREDADARVRRAAVSRIDDPGVLGDVGRSDPDEDVRAEAIRGLAGLAVEATDARSAAVVLRQLIELERPREVATVAKSAPTVEVRGAAVEALQDQKSLGSVSRHAPDSTTRLRALERVTDADEILAVALKSEHTDAAVAALERVTDVEALGSIAQRARNKVAARRARVRLRAIEEAAQPAPEPIAVKMSAADRQRAIELRQRAEALVTIADPAEATSKLGGGRGIRGCLGSRARGHRGARA